jgi:hypothetical protein
MDKLLVSHPRDWALIKDALAYEAEAKPAPAEPVGWKLVPVEPTQKMIERGRWDEFGEDCTRAYPAEEYRVRDVWEAMLAAAPAAPAPVPLTDEEVRRGWGTVSLHPHVDDRFTAGVRFAERAHGIGKGGAA